jgi:hypothetical protein
MKIYKYFNSEIGIRSLLIFVIFLIYFFYIISNKLFEISNNFTLFFFFILLTSVIHFSKYLTKFLSAIFLLFLLTYSIPFFVRILSFSFTSFGFAGIIDSDYFIPSPLQISRSIIFFSILNIVFFVVLILLNNYFIILNIKFIEFSHYLFRKKKAIEIILFIIISIHIFMSIVFGWKMGSESWKFGFVSKLLPITFFFNLFIINVIANWRNYYHLKKIKVSLIFFLFVINGLLIGSRSGIYFLSLNLLFSYLFFYKDFKFKLFNLFVYGPILIFLALSFFLFATSFRSGNSFSLNFVSVSLISLDALNRISSSTDSFIAIVNNYNNCLYNIDLINVMSTNNLIKQLTNSLIPGKIFDVSEYYIPATFFRTHVLGIENLNYNGDLFSGFGWYYIKYGYLVFFIFPSLLIFYLFIIRYLSNYKGIFFSFCIYFINWFTFDFFLHGSFLLSGLVGLLTNIFIVFFTHYLFSKLYAS